MILKNVTDLLKGKDFPHTAPQDSVEEACIQMSADNARALVVTDQGKMVGLLSEKDIVQKCIAQKHNPANCKVSEIMTTDVTAIDAKDTVAHAIDMMTQGHFHHLPVVDGENVLGMIYSDDIPEEYKLLLEHYKELRG